MTTNKGGQPPHVFTPEQVIEVGALAAVLSQEQIADYFGIARNTFTAICERQPEVLEQYKKGKARAIGTVAKGLVKQAMDGNTSAAMFYLKTQAGWRETSVQEEENKEAKNNPKNTITINVVDARKNAKSK
jgi:hypothetical protein